MEKRFFHENTISEIMECKKARFVNFIDLLCNKTGGTKRARGVQNSLKEKGF